MTTQRRVAKPVDPSDSHYSVSVTHMKSGLVHVHLTSYHASPRRVAVDCMLETTPKHWNLTSAVQLLYAGMDLAADRLTPPDHSCPPYEQGRLW